MSAPSLWRRGALLGLLIAVGAIAIDLYVPAFAAIANELSASPGQVQLTMTAYFLAVAAGQVVYGPISDAVGRRRPLFAGLAVFAAGSLLAAFAPSIEALIAARTLQGFGPAVTAVVPLAVISDEHTGPDAARLLSLAILSLSVSPILAPTAGGLLVQLASWRAVFAVLTAAALLAVLLAWARLPETLPPDRRVSAAPASVLATYGRLLRDRRFTVPLAMAGLGQSVLLVFISGSPFVFVTLRGLSPSAYGALFALHAAALVGVSQANAWLLRRFGARGLLGAATVGAAALAVLLAALVATADPKLPLFLALSVPLFACLGVVLPAAFVTAMEPFAATAGAAAALGVALELAVSTSATLLLSQTQDGTARPMTLLMAASACGALAAWGAFASARRRAPA